MDIDKYNDLSYFFTLEKRLLPVGFIDWCVEKIEYCNEDEVLRKVISNYHQTNQYLVSTLNKPISQLTTIQK